MATLHLGGALSRPPAGAGALGHVEGEHVINGVGLAMQPEMVPALNTALDATIAAFGPWSNDVHYLTFADRPSDGSKGFAKKPSAPTLNA